MEKLKEIEKLIIKNLEIENGDKNDDLLYFIFDFLIQHLIAGLAPEFVKKILFARNEDNRSFLHSLFWFKSSNKNLIENILKKSKKVKKYFPDDFVKLFKLIFRIFGKDLKMTKKTRIKVY